MPSYVVTGASRGMGLEFCKQLLAKGNTVVALARQPEESDGLKRIAHQNLHVIKADITDAASLEAAAASTAKFTGGSVDILINNAFFSDPSTFFTGIDQFPDHTSMVKDFNDNWNTNVIGTLLTTTVFLPLLKKGTVKKVMTLSIGFGDLDFNLASGISYQAAYCSTKAALQMVVAKFAMALKGEGFSFFSINPGVVNTMTAPPPPEVMPLMMDMVTKFQQVYPHWNGQPIEPSESVDKMLKTLDSFKQEETGKFTSIYGNRNWL